MKKVLSALFIILFFISCSMMKLGYNNADWLLTWRIDDYFDLSSEQEDFVEERLEEHLLWHRNTELPRYSEIIDEMIYRVDRGITGEDYEWAITQFQDVYQKTILQIIPDATTLLMNLEQEQIIFYEDKIAERYNKPRDVPERTEEEQKQRRGKRTIDRMEEWFGELSEQQKDEIIKLSSTLPRRNHFYREDRKRRHYEFIALLKSNLTEDEFAEKLKIHFTDFDRGRSDEYKEVNTIYNEAAKNMAVEISKILTQEQKEYAFERIRSYQIDFRELATSE